MSARLKSWAVAVACFVAAILLMVLLQSHPLRAQVSDRPPFLDNPIDSFDIYQPDATAFSIWNSDDNPGHQVWFRILGGDAQYQQRLRVYKEQAPPRPINEVPPLSELVLEIADNTPTDWYFLGVESAFHTYYFDGDNRPPGFVNWDNAKAVRGQRTAYENGDLYAIRFEDLNTLDDYNDLEVEVVLVHR